MSTDEDSTKFWSVFSLDNQREYCSGEKRALIRTIVTCSQFNVKLPAWAREAIVEAYISLPESWDDVFGRPVVVDKGKSVEAAQAHRNGSNWTGQGIKFAGRAYWHCFVSESWQGIWR